MSHEVSGDECFPPAIYDHYHYISSIPQVLHYSSPRPTERLVYATFRPIHDPSHPTAPR